MGWPMGLSRIDELGVASIARQAETNDVRALCERDDDLVLCNQCRLTVEIAKGRLRAGSIVDRRQELAQVRVRLEGVPVLDPGRVARTPRRQLLVFEVREHGLVRLAGTERVHGSRPYSTEPDCLKRPDVPWGRRRLLREPLPVCVADRLRAVADADLREEVVDVALDGRLADEQ